MIQIDMPMPKACYDCLLNYDFCWCNGFYNREEWEKYSDDWNLQVCEAEHRPEYCPLKEQEAVKPVRDKKTGRFWLCGNCGQYVGYEDNDPSDPNEFDNYCRECGRSVKWG